jgi:FtsH-binding integral membrane protein
MVRSAGASSVALSFGIIVVGLGLALMTIISIAGDSPEIGVGIGGAIVILGAAFIVRSLVVRSHEETPLSRTEPVRPREDDAV